TGGGGDGRGQGLSDAMAVDRSHRGTEAAGAAGRDQECESGGGVSARSFCGAGGARGGRGGGDTEVPERTSVARGDADHAGVADHRGDGADGGDPGWARGRLQGEGDPGEGGRGGTGAGSDAGDDAA